MMTDITVIVLVGNEELHIGRCLEKLAPLEPREVIVVESQAGDRTHEIAIAHGATCIWHDWPGNQAAQFNWLLDHHQIGSRWILRLDADEYLLPEAVDEIKQIVMTEEPGVVAYQISLARRWFGKPIFHGSTTLWVTRLFRAGCGRYPDGAEMDEHLEVSGGETRRMKGKFVDDSLMTFDAWKDKHRGYAKREADAYWRRKLNKRESKGKKGFYDKLPLFVRPIVYWALRYVFMLGFLDGRDGLSWNFWQGFWYRWIVDCEIVRVMFRKRRK